MVTASAATTQSCDLCGSAEHQVFARKGRYGMPLTTVICHGCGLVYTNPRPTEEETRAFYADQYWGQYKNQSEPDERFFQRRLPKIKSMLAEVKPFLKPGAAVLEIGCSVGALLWRMREALGGSGTVVGVEAHKGHARFACDHKQLDVRQGLLHEVAPGLAPGSFDVTVMNHVLEHTMSPLEVLETVRDLLKPGGVLILEVPNVEAPGSSLTNFFHIAHNYAFSPATLRRLGLRAGFHVQRVDALDGDLPRTRLFAIFEKPKAAVQAAPATLPADNPDGRAEALRKYDRWYLLTAASLRKKVTHWRRHRM